MPRHVLLLKRRNGRWEVYGLWSKVYGDGVWCDLISVDIVV